MRYITPHLVTFRDRRNGQQKTKPVNCSNPEGAQRALGKTRGGAKNVEILQFDGVDVENPTVAEAPAKRERQLHIPSVEQIIDFDKQKLMHVVEYFRQSATHRAYFDAMPLNRSLDDLKEMVIARLHPPEGVDPPELPEVPQEA